jgi:hypothetical protein
MSEIRVSAQRDFLVATVISAASIKKCRLKVYERKILLTGKKMASGNRWQYIHLQYTKRDSRIGSGLRESSRGSTIVLIDRLTIVKPRELSRSPEPILESRWVYIER